ncbi:MAG: PEP-CTERM sorting domain-containing protein, partial [Alphaproteobacteria bacterium]|nr:PEP-CTERM sorting domain-containing protein [Alphaproteobacteria bacterium]
CGGACSVSQLASLGFTQLSVFENAVLNPSANAVSTSVVGRYALIAGQYGESDDYFKFAGITNIEIEVPEPGTLALSVVGLAALWSARRRRMRKSA